jgi:hypothetical protein
MQQESGNDVNGNLIQEKDIQIIQAYLARNVETKQ